MAGHGDIARKEWYFIPHELTTPEEEEEVVKLGVSTPYITEVLKDFESQKILVVIDACKSGGIVSGISGGIRGYEDRKVLKATCSVHGNLCHISLHGQAGCP